MDAKLQEIANRLKTSIGALSVAETQARSPGHWSVQQIAEHLTLTYASTAKIVLDRLEKGWPTRSRPSLQQHCKRLYVVRLGLLPKRFTGSSRCNTVLQRSAPCRGGARHASHNGAEQT